MFSRLRVSPREGADGFYAWDGAMGNAMFHAMKAMNFMWEMHGNAIFIHFSCHGKLPIFKGWLINVSFGDGSRIFWSKITIKPSVVSLHYTTCYDLCTNLLWIYDAFHSDFIVVL